jgi:membrane associated rhomboid family serine protease/TolA-binding protein
VIPLGTDRPLARRTVVNHGLIAANLIIFGIIAIAGLQSERGLELVDEIQRRWMLLPSFREPWRLITYAFLHDMRSIWHLAGNMLFLWVFGPNVEDRFGRLGYLAFYLFAAAASGATHVIFSNGPAVGASGAIAAVTGAYLVLFPRTQIRVLFLFFFIGIIHMSALWFVSIQILLNMLKPLARVNDSIAYAAHLGGYAFGIIIALLLLVLRILPSETFDMFHLIRQARRRAEMREAHAQSKERRDSVYVAASGQPTSGKSAARQDSVESQISDLQRPIAELRAQIATDLTGRNLEAAAGGYKQLIEKYGLVVGAGTMQRRQQLELGNHLFQTQDFSLAVVAYERFLEAYPRDGQAGHVRLMLAVIAGRYLHQHQRARTLAEQALPDLANAEEIAIAKELIAEMGRLTAGQ